MIRVIYKPLTRKQLTVHYNFTFNIIRQRYA